MVEQIRQFRTHTHKVLPFIIWTFRAFKLVYGTRISRFSHRLRGGLPWPHDGKASCMSNRMLPGHTGFGDQLKDDEHPCNKIFQIMMINNDNNRFSAIL